MDTVRDHDGLALLRGAQEQWGHGEAARQAAILNALPAYIALLDTRGLVISVNDAWRQFVRASAIQAPGHGIGVNYVEICSSARGDGSSEAHQVAEGMRSVLGGGVKSFSIEYACHSPTRWFLLTVTSLSDDRPSGALVMHLDITQRKQAADELRRSESLKSAILESSPDCLITIDHAGRIVEFNPAAEATFGLTREQVLGKPMVELIIPPRLRDAHRRGFAHCLATGTGPILGKRLELEALRADGTEFPIELAIMAIGETSTPMFTGFVRDITARKEADGKIKRLNRVYAVLSGINTLIVRVRDRNELFREACRIAVDEGGFLMSMISILDRNAMKIVPVASAGQDEGLLTVINGLLSSSGRAPDTMVARAISQKRALVSNDTQRDPRVLLGKTGAESGVRAMAILPLIVSDEVAGVLALYAGEMEFFHEEELKLLTELAGNISFALDHIGKEDRIARLSRIHAVLSGINSVIVRVRDRQELFSEACRIAVEDGQFPFAWIGLLDPATQDVTPHAWAGEGAEELTKTKSSARDDIQAGKGGVGRAIRERRPIFNNDITARSLGGPREKEILRLGFRSQVTLPLYASQTVVGTLTMYAREPDVFDEQELKLLTELAGDISFALENIAKQQKLDKLARIRTVSGEINAAIIRIHDREALLGETCRIAVDHGKFELVWIAVLDQRKQKVQPIAWTGFSPEAAQGVSWSTISAGRGTLGEAILTRKPAMRNDIGVELAGGKLRHEALLKGCRSTASLPLVVDGKVVAIVALFAPGAGFFDEEELVLLNEVAGNISFALEHIEGAEKIARLSRIQALMGSINALIVRVRDRQDLFDEACRIAVEHGGFGIAWIGTFDPKTLDVTPVAHAGFQADESLINLKSSARAEHPLGWGVVGRAIRARTPVFVDDLPKEPGAGRKREEAIRRGYHSRIALPLLMDDGVVGVMVLFAKELDFFNEEELKLLTQLAGDISFALENLAKQQKLDKLARIRAVSGEINAAIIRIHEREALLRETCRIAVEHGKFELAWIALLDQEKQHIQPVAWAGFSSGIAHELTWAHLSRPGATLTEVIRTRKVAVRNDIDPEMPAGNLRQAAMKIGYRSTVCVPFMVDDSVVAAIILFALGRGFFDEEELALLNEVAANVSLALQAIAKQEKLEYLSYYDVLTGLPNRTLFVDRLSQQMRARGGEQQMVAVILLDIERFRHINESLGHRGGDGILNSIAQRLGHAFEGKDYLARISSNGFGAIVRGMKDAASVVHLVENEVFSCLKQPFMVSDRELWISVKAGIAMFPVDGESAGILFGNAESALKRAKASSDRYLFYAADMNAQAAHAVALETRLRKAVDARQFVLHYQPKIELATGRICGLEALIRWNDPVTGLTPPMKFIPTLEETGLILEVGMWALQQAVSDHARWAAQGLRPPRIAVNVSQIQLRHAGFVEMVAHAARIHAHGAFGLALEITESLFMENFEESVRKLKAIRDMGIEIAVDDFGTGYSSLSYISRLPIDALKIDRSFVVKMESDPHSMSIVAMIITLAHALNLKVIAEGVETMEQSNTLQLLRCDEAQGYLFAKALPGENVEALLRERPGAERP